ncbi:hypothetical protein KR215_004731 [Drosophila sulfurigaster]|nr:hypothetical protein KR215_004731 [Drosophila sulfurigaster]
MDEETTVSIHTVCRTCLSNLNNAAAFDLFFVPGLAKKLCICTSLSVEQQDGYPKNLCTTCYNRLNDLHDFQRQCVESVEKFKDLVVNSCFQQTTEDNFNVTNVAEEDLDRSTFDPLLNSKLEIENEEDVFKMIEDVDKESEEDEQQQEQPEEFDDFDNDDDEGDADFQADSSDSQDSVPLSRRFATKATKQTKPKNKKKKKESSSSASDTEDEAEEAKPKKKRKRTPASEVGSRSLLQCHICQQKFKMATRFEEHMKFHNDKLPFQCPVESCKKGFTSTTGQRHHMEHTHPELCKLHKCTVEGCDKEFPQTRMLTQHLRKEHNIAKPEIHPCSECDKVFRCPTALKKHMYKHTGEELPISCNICGKRFHINSELRDHLLRHAGVKNHVCPYCGVGKTTRQEWNKHILTHTKEKQYHCRQCDHSSHNKQALSNHVKVVHMKIKNFACQYCGKTFGKSHACKLHERLHTGENCSECKICGKVFLFEKRLTKHLKTHEKREVPAAAGAAKPKTDGDDKKDESQEPADVKPMPPLPAKPKASNRIERVDISQLAGTSVNPIPSVSVPSWSPQVNFTKKEGQHICPGCGKGFNHIGNMKLHYKVVHEKIKDFACRYCPKRFGKAQYLQHHEYTHTGEKPYGCKICDRHFSHGSSLRKHMQSHNKPPKEPKPPKPQPKSTEPPTPRVKLNRQPTKIYEQYQDPAAERAAARAELIAQQQDEHEVKRKAAEKIRKIQEAACEQLQELQQQQLIDKISSDCFTEVNYEDAQKVEALKEDPA